MIEAIMYCAIGFLAATLLALLALPAVWRRAVRLTRRRIENALPVTLAEIQADKDEARAAFATTVRRLEMDVDQLRTRLAGQWSEIARQSAELASRQARLDEASTRLAALESEHAGLVARDRMLADDLAARSLELDETRALFENTRADLASTGSQLEEATARQDELKFEHIALATLRDTLKDRIADLERHVSAANAQLANERSSLQSTSESLSAEIARGRAIRQRLEDTEHEFGTISAEAATLRAHIASLQLRADALQDRTRKAETRRDSVEQEAARVTSQALAARESAESAARQANDTSEMLRAEKAMLEGALAKARDDRTQLQERLDTLQPAARTPDEPAGIALLRERLSDIAAEMAHLTATLEGPGSAVDALLAGAPPSLAGAAPTLADRIRTLREGATRRSDGRSELARADAARLETTRLEPTRLEPTLAEADEVGLALRSIERTAKELGSRDIAPENGQKDRAVAG
ncbi:hypothetical protein [Ancylobacter amanitiformis]|uniref:Nuclease with TOPRIM domain n=1 Tax=Ancylobacter amanitiformis TaxID=217069 RepID=A0ABU0LUE9_9HYPH|nr:hypothetical protein [Ancylobacter amanitiformis]MDQ0512233.1 putative nuclease with TOPRIM domain [Ancylobacter amanitiformis]